MSLSDYQRSYRLISIVKYILYRHSTGKSKRAKFSIYLVKVGNDFLNLNLQRQNNTIERYVIRFLLTINFEFRSSVEISTGVLARALRLFIVGTTRLVFYVARTRFIPILYIFFKVTSIST